MKTNQIMKRELDGATIHQRTSDGFFNATDIVKSYNDQHGKSKRLREFLSNSNTKQFCEALSNELNTISGKSSYIPEDLIITTRGAMGSTWVHPYIMVKLAMWLSPELEVKVIKWIYDHLIEFRLEAGDHYKEMCGCIQEKYIQFYNKSPDPLVFIKEARFLNELVFGDGRSRQRNEATESQLRLLNALQKANILLINQGASKGDRKIKLRDFSQMYS